MTDTNPQPANSNAPPNFFKRAVAKITAFLSAVFAKLKAWVQALWQRFTAKS